MLMKIRKKKTQKIKNIKKNIMINIVVLIQKKVEVEVDLLQMMKRIK